MKNCFAILTVILLALCLSFSLAPQARAELRIDVSGAHSDPMPIAIPTFLASSDVAKPVAENITKVVSADLERSGLFSVMNPDSFVQKFTSVNEMPKFNDWQVISAAALVQGAVEEQAGDKLKVSFRLWDVFASMQMEGKVMTTKADNWRRIAHIIADAIYKRITGEAGYFDTRIVYIAESGPKDARIKRLAVMDQDGENVKVLTDGKAMVLTPRFSPNMQQITYLSYYNNRPRVYIFDIETGKQSVVGNFPGMTFAPRFSPDGKSIIMSMATGGNSEIYKMDLKTKKTVRLTNHPAIDTSPSYSPDGKYISFNSDRSGTQQLYVMKADGKDVRRISFGNGKYATPVWSPRGDYIAFTKIADNTFYIGVMFPDGTGERQLAEGYLVEAPTWAPNGRVLTYFKQASPDDEVKIYTVDITGYNERMIDTPTEASDPAWSPLLP